METAPATQPQFSQLFGEARGRCCPYTSLSAITCCVQFLHCIPYYFGTVQVQFTCLLCCLISICLCSDYECFKYKALHGFKTKMSGISHWLSFFYWTCRFQARCTRALGIYIKSSVLIEAEEYSKTIRASIFSEVSFYYYLKKKKYQESIGQKPGSFIVFEAIIQEKKKNI